MKRQSILNLFITITIFICFTQFVSSQTNSNQKVLYTNSYALIIGNSNYQKWEKLPGVSFDISEVEKVLSLKGFQVEIGKDLTEAELRLKIEKFIDDYGSIPDARLVFYFAGHGFTDVNESDQRDFGYFVPIDAPLPSRDPKDFRNTAINMVDFDAWAKKIRSKHALFVFDSCFSGSLVSRGEMRPRKITDQTFKPARQFITAGSNNETVPDKSIFREFFVKGLKGAADLDTNGTITAQELSVYLKTNVYNSSGERQTPQYDTVKDPNLNKGDMILMTNGIIELRGDPPPPQPPIGNPPTSTPINSLMNQLKSISTRFSDAFERGDKITLGSLITDDFLFQPCTQAIVIKGKTALLKAMTNKKTQNLLSISYSDFSASKDKDDPKLAVLDSTATSKWQPGIIIKHKVKQILVNQGQGWKLSSSVCEATEHTQMGTQ